MVQTGSAGYLGRFARRLRSRASAPSAEICQVSVGWDKSNIAAALGSEPSAPALLVVALPTALLNAVDPRSVNGHPWTATSGPSPSNFQRSMTPQLLSAAWGRGWMLQRDLELPDNVRHQS